MSETPLFTVITPTYNRSENGFLVECVKSVQMQKTNSFSYEHIIIDDGSVDNTEGLVSSMMVGDARIKYYKKKNEGTPKAIQKGISVAKGAYIVILGDDDLLPKNSLEKRAAYINSHSGLDWFYGKTQRIDELGNHLETLSQSIRYPSHHYAMMFLSNFIQGGTTTIKTEVMKEIKWPDWLTTRDDDFIAFELTKPQNKYRFEFCNEILYYYRDHDKDKRQSASNFLDTQKLAEIDYKIRYQLNDPELAFLGDKAREVIFLKQELTERDARLYKIYHSIFWKITAPIRFLEGKIKE